MIDKIEILRRAKTRRAKLYHIREKAARAIRREMRRMSFVNLSTGSDMEMEAQKAKQAEEEAKKVEEEAAKKAEEEAKATADATEDAPSEEPKEETSAEETKAEEKEEKSHYIYVCTKLEGADEMCRELFGRVCELIKKEEEE